MPPQTNTTTRYRITQTHCTINLFGDIEPKNRRMTPQEEEDEKFWATLFKRPRRAYILDKPIYPYVPTPPPPTKCMVNFDLNYP